jgi:MFS family permease
MDNLGAIVGPLLALLLVALIGIRDAILVSIVPGLLAALAIAYGARHVRRPTRRERQRIRLQVRPVLRGRLGRLFVGMGAFEFGNAAATLMILRATELLTPSHGRHAAAEIALLLYVGYNGASTLASVPGGRLSDRRSAVHALIVGAAASLVAYLIFASSGSQIPILLGAFVLAGVGIGFAETAEATAVASMAEGSIRGSAFGLLAGLQSLGNFAASAIAGVLWTVLSPTVAFVWLAAWMAAASIAFLLTPGWPVSSSDR